MVDRCSANLELSQKSKIELYEKIFKAFQLLNIFAKSFILDVWLDF